MKLNIRAFALTCGLIWGLGLLASSGDGYENDFGDAYYGDIVDRALFATAPIW